VNVDIVLLSSPLTLLLKSVIFEEMWECPLTLTSVPFTCKLVKLPLGAVNKDPLNVKLDSALIPTADPVLVSTLLSPLLAIVGNNPLTLLLKSVILDDV
jgi:hypothetical protein